MTKQDRINELEAQIDAKNAVISAAHEGMDRLCVHLYSPKFKEDPTIQTADVYFWIRQIRSNMLDEEMTLRGEAHPIRKSHAGHTYNCDCR